jgi:mono/diheme cytochrome c family protein
MPMKRATTVFVALAALGAAAAAAAAVFVWSGVYEISATVQHTQPVFSLLELVGQRSIRRHAEGIAAPRLDDPARIARGALCYRDKCQVCHGGPGVAQGEIGRSMQPLPGPLVDAARRFSPPELYWVVRKGIKMSGMPAWEYRMSDADLWSTVAFLERLPALTPAQFREATVGEACVSAPETGALPAADAARGKVALTQYACNACHLIPGVTGSQVHVGPPLAGIASRGLIAGQLVNTPEHLALWIREPQKVDPDTAMPTMGVDERDARDIAAYLGTLY